VWCLYNNPKNFITFTQSTQGAPIIIVTFNDEKFYIGAVAYNMAKYNHIVLTCNTSGDTSKIQFYVNGVLTNYNGSNYSNDKPHIVWDKNTTITLTKDSATSSLFDGANTKLYVLGGPPGTGITWPSNSSSQSNGFNGYISKLTIYNNALTKPDATALYNSQTSLFT